MQLIDGFFAFSALGLISKWNPQSLPFLVWWYLLWFVLTRQNGYLTDTFGKFLAAVIVCASAPVIIMTLAVLLQPLNSAQALMLASPFYLFSGIYSVYKIIAASPSSIQISGRSESIKLPNYEGD